MAAIQLRPHPRLFPAPPRGEAAPRRHPRGAGLGHLDAASSPGGGLGGPGTSGPSERVWDGGGTALRQGGCATCGDPTRARGSRPLSRAWEQWSPRTSPAAGAAAPRSRRPWAPGKPGTRAASETNFPTSCSRWQQSSYFVPTVYF